MFLHIGPYILNMLSGFEKASITSLQVKITTSSPWMCALYWDYLEPSYLCLVLSLWSLIFSVMLPHSIHFFMCRKSSCLQRMLYKIQECYKLLNFNFSQSYVTLTKINVINMVTRLKQQLLERESCVWDGTWEWEWTEEGSWESSCEYQKNNKSSEWGG